MAPPTPAAPPPENVGAAASRIFDGASTQAKNGSAARLRGLRVGARAVGRAVQVCCGRRTLCFVAAALMRIHIGLLA